MGQGGKKIVVQTEVLGGGVSGAAKKIAPQRKKEVFPGWTKGYLARNERGAEAGRRRSESDRGVHFEKMSDLNSWNKFWGKSLIEEKMSSLGGRQVSSLENLED